MGREKPNSYTAEFKESAVKLANEPDQSVALVAEGLGINVNTLPTWIAKHGKAKTTDKPERTDGHLYDELKRLRKEVARLTEGRDLLKKRRRTLPRSNGEVRLGSATCPRFCRQQALSTDGRFKKRLL